jgi:hypothetical protein
MCCHEMKLKTIPARAIPFFPHTLCYPCRGPVAAVAQIEQLLGSADLLFRTKTFSQLPQRREETDQREVLLRAVY